MYLGGIGPGDFVGVFDKAISFFRTVSTLTLLGPSLRKNKIKWEKFLHNQDLKRGSTLQVAHHPYGPGSVEKQ